MLNANASLQLEILPPGTDLRQHEVVAAAVDVSMLPKAIGGEALSINEESGEEDEHFSRGIKHGSLSEFLERLSS